MLGVLRLHHSRCDVTMTCVYLCTCVYSLQIVPSNPIARKWEQRCSETVGNSAGEVYFVNKAVCVVVVVVGLLLHITSLLSSSKTYSGVLLHCVMCGVCL